MTQPYQKHSDTSRMAAESLETAETMEGEILALLASAGAEGMIGDDIALVLAKSHPTLQSGTIAARLRGLELKGKACQTIHTRLTRNNRQAHVWKLPEHTLKMEVLPAQDKPEKERNRELIEATAFFLQGLVKSGAIKYVAHHDRCHQLSCELFKMLERK